MKKLIFTFLALCACMGMSAQTYTDITPSKFDFNKYEVGTIDNFWDANLTGNHAAGSNAVKALANDADFTDGYAYFYFNQATNPNTYTKIVNVDGIGNVLQFGAAGLGSGFGGCYFIPTDTLTAGPMRATIICRFLYEATGSKKDTATLQVGTHDAAGSGPEAVMNVAVDDLKASAAAGEWYKVVVEYTPIHALRFNFSQLIWSDNIQIAQIKFETMKDVPGDYTPVQTCTAATPADLGLDAYTVNVTNLGYATFYGDKVNPLAIPAGVEAYACVADVANSIVNLKPITGYIPANTAVILSAAEGTYKFEKYTGVVPAVATNDLIGSATAITLDGSVKDYYLLSKDDADNAVFKKVSSSGTAVSAAHKGYIQLDKSKSLAPLRIVKGDVSGLKNIATELNGDNVTYNVYGQEVDQNYRGIVIRNGKKFIQ